MRIFHRHSRAWKSGLLAAMVAAAALIGVVHRVDAPMVPVAAETARPASTIVAKKETMIHAAPAAVEAPRRIPSLLPAVNQPDIRPIHRMLADEVIRALPPFCRDHLKDFYVLYDPKNTNRGLGGASTILVTGLVPDEEFRALVIHECGHVTDLGGLIGTPESGRTAFFDGQTPIYADDPSLAFYQISWQNATERKPGSRAEDFASGYAASDVFEDFAEHFALYALHREAFAALAEKNPILAQKYAFMRTVVFGERADISKSEYSPTRSIPWDITKLPYVWYAKQ